MNRKKHKSCFRVEQDSCQTILTSQYQGFCQEQLVILVGRCCLWKIWAGLDDSAEIGDHCQEAVKFVFHQNILEVQVIFCGGY